MAVTAPASPSLRSPTVDDDCTLGYRPGDLWQFSGQVWRCASVVAGAAEWLPLVADGLPGDIEGAVFAGGVGRVVTGYHGPLVDIVTMVSGTATTTTIGQLASGTLDRDALAAALFAADAGTYAVAVRVYNQVSGQEAGHLEAMPQGPHVGVVRLDGRETLSWGSDNGPTGLLLANARMPADEMFVGLLGRFHSTNGASGVQPTVFSAGTLVTESPRMVVGMTSSFSGTTSISSAFTGRFATAPFSFDAAPGVSVVAVGEAATYFASSRTALELAFAPSANVVEGVSIGYVGGDATGNVHLAYLQRGTADMQLSAIVVAQVKASQERVDGFRASALASMGYAPQERGELVVIGDSRTYGNSTCDGLTWTSFLTGRAARVHQHNFAVSGATTQQILDALPQALIQGRAGERRVAVIWIGINDRVRGIETTTTIRNIQILVLRLQAAGFWVAVVDETVGSNDDNLVLRMALKNALAHGVIPADLEIDPFAPGMVLADQGNAAYWNSADHIHPNSEGGRALGPFIAERINAFFEG